MQIKNTVRYHLIPIGMAIIQKRENNKCWRGCGEIENFVHRWWECKMIWPLWKTIWWFLKKLKISIWSINSTSGYIPKRIESRGSKKYLYTNVHSIIQKSQKVEATQVSINGWMNEWTNKMCYTHRKHICIYVYTHIYIQNGIIALRRKEILTHATTWMNLENMLSEMNQSQKWQLLCDSTYMRSLEQSDAQRQRVELTTRCAAWVPQTLTQEPQTRILQGISCQVQLHQISTGAEHRGNLLASPSLQLTRPQPWEERDVERDVAFLYPDGSWSPNVHLQFSLKLETNRT